LLFALSSWYDHKPVLSYDRNVSNIYYAYLFLVGTLLLDWQSEKSGIEDG
jgi:hypothetical protein